MTHWHVSLLKYLWYDWMVNSMFFSLCLPHSLFLSLLLCDPDLFTSSYAVEPSSLKLNTNLFSISVFFPHCICHLWLCCRSFNSSLIVPFLPFFLFRLVSVTVFNIPIHFHSLALFALAFSIFPCLSPSLSFSIIHLINNIKDPLGDSVQVCIHCFCNTNLVKSKDKRYTARDINSKTSRSVSTGYILFIVSSIFTAIHLQG